MRYEGIRAGDKLRLKKDNPYGFGPITITVVDVVTRGGYRVPWIVDTLGRSFRPKDFSGRA